MPEDRDFRIDPGSISLFEHIQLLLNEKDLRYQQRFEALEGRLLERFEAQEKRVTAAFHASEEAIKKAEVATQLHFQNINDLQRKMDAQHKESIQQNKESVTRELFDTLVSRVGMAEARIDRSEGRRTGLSSGWVMLIGAVGLIATLVAIFAAIR